jgi:pimeloyl-ACP methyl ester carboxylesterase
MNRLRIVVAQVDELEQYAKQVLEGSSRPPGHPSMVLSEDAIRSAKQLLQSANELWDFVTSLKPPSSDGDDSNHPNNSNSDMEENLTVDAMRKRFEEQSGSAMETLKSGFSSILPMLDPPPHTSIFGFDVQRGCMLSRYTGARQLWVRRPKGGMLDVLHFPARNYAPNVPRNDKAVLYCNPNAGMVEVATGINLVGGNVPSADPDNAHDDSWTDYYTDLGYDVYLFNYAGYGRSFGTTLCVSGRNAGDWYTPGCFARLTRIVRSCFLTFTPTPDTLRDDGITVGQYLLQELGIQKLIVHGESIGGVAASATARYLSSVPSLRSRVALLICDRTFCNLEAVAQRLVGGWSGYAIRLLAPLWSTDVAGDFLAASCPKVIASDAADSIISDAASLKSGVALWKEIHRGAASTKGIGWLTEAPLQYRMADWENVCVNDSRYIPATGFFSAKAPVWPNDKHVSVEEAFHFSACCKRIGKCAKAIRQTAGRDIEGDSVEMDARGEPLSGSQPLLMEVWKMLACCDGLTGAPLGIAVRSGFDATVAWLCSCLVFGAQSIVEVAESRGGSEGWKESFEIFPADFDSRPPDYEAKEAEGLVHPKPIPEVLERVVFYLDAGDETLAACKWLCHPQKTRFLLFLYSY